MTATPTQNDSGLKERFFRAFQEDVKALHDQIDSLGSMSVAGGARNDAIDDCLAAIDKLSHEVKDASGYIPAYDQRTYSETIKALSEKVQTVRNSFNPPKKFSFKTRKATSKVSANDNAESANSSVAPAPLDTLSTPAVKQSPQENIEEEIDDGIIPGPGIHRPSFSNSKNVTISKHNGLHIILPSTASHATSAGTVANLTRCVVDLSAPTTTGSPFAALYLKNIKSSLVVCGEVAGAIHITNVEDSVIVTTCRQFRMHESQHVAIYLHSASRPILEDCEHLRFAYLPEAYSNPDTKTANLWDQIDDFKWLKAEPSPHFRIMPESERIREDVWRSVVQGGDGLEVEDILHAVGISAQAL
ncbi:hypothetical protein ACN47E_007107 [Coniothyrium glycines]